MDSRILVCYNNSNMQRKGENSMTTVSNQKIENNLVDITPDVRLLRVLRNSGFNMQTAMGEILDNAIDAGASQIDISIYLNNLQRKNIMITDNGKGMNIGTLQYALTLAKELKVGIDQLGKYGMGMKTASLSFSTSFIIFTKTVSGEVLFGEFNINKMEQAGEFKTEVREATEEEKLFFFDKVGKRTRSGTIIIIQNCDRLDANFSTFVRQLSTYIGLTYRHAIQRGINFTLSDTPKKANPIAPIDPLMRDHTSTQLIAEKEAFPVEYLDEAGKKKTTFIEISVALLPRPDKAGKGKTVGGKNIVLPMNQSYQGIYVYREGRMVGQALTWTEVTGERHNSKNRYRIELYVKSQLDDEIRMNHQKGNVSPTNVLKNQLAQVIEPLMREARIQEQKEEEVLQKRKHPTPMGNTVLPKTELNGEEKKSEEEESTIKTDLVVSNDSEGMVNPNGEEDRLNSDKSILPTQSNTNESEDRNNSEDEIYLLWINKAIELGEFLKNEDIPNEIKDVIKEHILNA